MSLLEAIILGIIQGLTEFLPISSTAHLRVIPSLLGWQDPGAAFTAVIQLGTLFAVIIYFYSDIVKICKETLLAIFTFKPFRNHYAKMGWRIVIGTLPIVFFGLLLKDFIEGKFRSLYIVSASLIFFSITLYIAEKKYQKRINKGDQPKDIEHLTWSDSFNIGLRQALALIPGASRSGVTLTGGLQLGYSREASARYSFLLSVPSVFAAGIYQLFNERASILDSSNNLTTILTATIVSGIVGYMSIAFLLNHLKKNTTLSFIVYRIGFGILILGLLYFGFIN